VHVRAGEPVGFVGLEVADTGEDDTVGGDRPEAVDRRGERLPGLACNDREAKTSKKPERLSSGMSKSARASNQITVGSPLSAAVVPMALLQLPASTTGKRSSAIASPTSAARSASSVRRRRAALKGRRRVRG
jgi:hypothetical protein